VTDPLESWAVLNREVMRLPEADLQTLLKREAQRRPAPRPVYLNRIYCRFSRVRRDRELAALGLQRGGA
jgi:hypothetical protein